MLFEPIAIGPKTLRNRFYQTPHSTGFGERPASQAAFRATRAAGGWAGVNLELTSIDPEADRSPVPTPAKLWDDSDVARVRLLADAVHAEGSIVGAELWHGGYNIDGSPSRLPPGGPGVLPADHFPLTYSYAMSRAQIGRVVGLYADAAARAEAAGLDLVYAYGSHSYLPAQFLSPFANRRDDEYGGSLRNRARFWLEVIEAVRTATGGRLAIAVRIGIDPSATLGLGIDDVLAFVRMADDMVDLWDVNVATIGEPWLDMRPSRIDAQGYQTALSGRVREATAKPIVGVGRLTDPDAMAEIVRSGVWDIVGGARPSIADPYLPAKIEAGRYDDIRECIGCNICLARVQTSDQIMCTQNPTAGEEHRRGWHPERVPPVADRAPRRARGRRRRRRHAVRADAGPARAGARAPGRAQPRSWAATRRSPPACRGWGSGSARSTGGAGSWRGRRNVEVHTSTELTAAEIADYGADIVVLATGAEWRADGLAPATHEPLPGAGGAHTLTPEQVVAGAEVGRRVVVYDCEGYFMGAGMAELLAGRGHDVTLVTPLAAVGPFLDRTFEGDHARRRLHALGCRVVCETELTAVGAGAARDAQRLRRPGRDRRPTRSCWSPPADRATSCGSRSADAYAVGDCVAPRLLADCIFDGHRLAMEIEEPDPMVPARVLREPRVIAGFS